MATADLYEGMAAGECGDCGATLVWMRDALGEWRVVHEDDVRAALCAHVEARAPAA